MKTTNIKNNLLMIFSSLALISFAIFHIYDNLVVGDNPFLNRLGLLNDLFLAVPFVALFVFAIMQRFMKHTNKREFVLGIFVIYLMQALIFWFFDTVSSLSFFCFNFLEELSGILTIIFIIRIVVFALIPIAHKSVLEYYSVGMIAFIIITSIYAIVTDKVNYDSIVEAVIAIAIDILFHIALYFFASTLDKDNISLSYLDLLVGIVRAIFCGLDDDDDLVEFFGFDKFDFYL